MENTIINNMLQMKEDIGKIAGIVNKHDTETFPQMQNTLIRMESKQNKDIAQFNEARDALLKRIDPLEKDYFSRMEHKKETEQEIKKIKWTVVSMGVVGATVGGWDHIVTFIKTIIK